MSVFDGAFGNLHNFVHFIALNNCVEYFNAEPNPADTTQRERSRMLFNAVVALDSAADHAYYAETRDVTFKQFRAQLCKIEPALDELRELANAMKHCVTGRADRLNGVELAQTTVVFDLDSSNQPWPAIRAEVETQLLADADRILEAAFRFWVGQAQSMDARAPRVCIQSEG